MAVLLNGFYEFVFAAHDDLGKTFEPAARRDRWIGIEPFGEILQIFDRHGPFANWRLTSDVARALAKRAKIRSVTAMSTVQEIETAIEKLTPAQQRELAAWYEERQALLNSSDSLFQVYDSEEHGK